MSASLVKTASLRIVWDVFAYFPCNASGVRVGVRRTRRGALRYMDNFAHKNRVATTMRFRLENSS